MMSLREALSELGTRQDQVHSMRSYIAGEYPTVIRALRLVDNDNLSPQRGKGYSLVKREHKTHGFLYYVRYYHNGEMLPTKWNTHTNILDEAERFARENKPRLVEAYLRSHDTRMKLIIQGV